MFYLLLAILCSAAIAIIMRVSGRTVKSSVMMLAVNYFVCLVFSAFDAGAQAVAFSAPGFAETLGFGLVNGFLYLYGFALLQRNTRESGVVLSSVFMKLGLLVPATLSILLFGERPSIVQGIGFVFALASVVLMNYEKGTSLSGFRMSLILMLLSCGCADAMSKVFKVYGPAENEKQFLLYTFTVACLLSVGWMLWKKERLEKSAVFYGLLMGVPNFFSAKFLLMSLDQLPAMIVYPMFSVATVLVVTVVGIFVFRERLRSSQWVALVGILIALTLLNL